MLEYISARKQRKKWGISERRVQKLCEENRIPGVAKFSRMWLIPKDAENPLTEDTRNGVIVLIRIAICDDEIGNFALILKNMILNYAKLQALQIDTEVFYSGETLFKTIENKDKYGLIFLDIQLLQLDGVQVGKQIRERLGNEKIKYCIYFF